MMRSIHNVVRGVQGLLWTPKKGGRLPLFGGTVATRKWSPFRSPAFGRVSTIAGALCDWRGLLVVGLLVGLAVVL